jgi:hypothetical protein
MFKVGAIATLVGVFHFLGTSHLEKTVPFLLKLPLVPLFSELQRGHRLSFDFRSFVFFYWALLGWAIENWKEEVWRNRIDHAVTICMWCFVVRCIGMIVNFREESFGSMVFVGMAASVNVLSRFLPMEGMYFLVHVVAAHFAIQLLAAAEADEGENKFSVRIRWVLFVPFARWMDKTN